MGNCGSNPKTKEGSEPVPLPVTEEVKVEQKESATNVETNTVDTPNDSDNKSLATLLNEKTEEAPRTEIEKIEAKAEEAKAEAKPEEVEAQ